MIESLISAAAAILVCMINNVFQHRKAEQQYNTTVALIEYKVEQLTHKMELHNNAVERLYGVEKAIEVHKEETKAIKDRISDLEKAEK